MQPRDPREILPGKGFTADPQARMRRARVIERHLPFGVLGIDSQPQGHMRGTRQLLRQALPLAQLRKGVEGDVVDA